MNLTPREEANRRIESRLELFSGGVELDWQSNTEKKCTVAFDPVADTFSIVEYRFYRIQGALYSTKEAWEQVLATMEHDVRISYGEEQ